MTRIFDPRLAVHPERRPTYGVRRATAVWLAGLVAGALVLATAQRAQAACSGAAPNGVGNTGEQCDDGNQVDTDGCTNACVTQTGYACSCPAGMLTGVTVDDPQTLLTIVGGTGGGAFADRCPAGQVTIGFDYTIGTFTGPHGWIASSRARCATLSISASTVTITPAGTTPSRGGGGGSTSTLTCPAGSVVAGYRGESRTEGGFVGIAGVQLHCSTLSVGNDGRVAVGAPSEGPFATPGGGTIVSVGPSLCPAGQVVSGNQGRSGSIVDQFTMLCQEVYTNCSAATQCSALCSDGVVTGGEACDDGNATDFDGCSSTCSLEAGFSCPTAGAECGAPCGNSIVTAGENCDDGDTQGGDGCSEDCQAEAGYQCVGTSVELVTNGSFAAGNTGFTSEYEYVASGSDMNEGVYAVRSDGHAFHGSVPSNWADQGGDGYQAFFNGTAGLTVYSTNVSVVEGRTYVFVAYAASWFDAVPAVLSFTMNGVPVTAPVTLPATVNEWVRVSGAYVATATGDVPVRIVNSQASTGGNDFALDSISVREATASDCATVCGDGLRVGAEACDDGDVDAADGCDAACAQEAGWTCTGAPSTCGAAACGDGKRVGAEACDDQNASAGDGCSDACAIESGWQCEGAVAASSTCSAAACGDRSKAGSETCDDGNTTAGDGCDAACAQEAGWSCTGAPSTCGAAACGDGLRVGTEACDDSNVAERDGCAASCAVEAGWTCTGDVGAASTCVADAPDAGTPDAGHEPADGCDCGTGSPMGLSMAFLSLLATATRRRRHANA